MPEIGLLEPRVLNGVINEFDPPEDFMGHTIVGAPVRDINPLWEYDIELPVRGAATTFNTPNAEARLVDHEPIGHMQGGYAYMRDKKLFKPTTLRWLRRAGENAVSRRNAEAYVLKEIQALRLQHQRGEEVAIWKMLHGSWTYDHISGHSQTINYNVPSAHQPTVVNGWGAAGSTPVTDIRAWKKQTERTSGYAIRYAYMNADTMTKFLIDPQITEEMSDRQKDRYRAEGVIPRFFGIDWIEYDSGYVDTDGSYLPYIEDDHIILLAPGGDDVADLLYGPSADHSSPSGHTGPFAKTWDEEDPSAKQFLLENNFMPALRKPNQLIIADVS